MFFSGIRKYFKSDSEATILEIFKPLYMLLSLFGLFPHSLNFKRKHSCVIRPRSIYVNSLCAVSMVLIALAFMALHIRGIVLLTDGNSLTDAIMTQINYIMELQTLTVVCLVMYYCAFLYRYQYVKIVNSLASLCIELPSTENKILQDLKMDVTKIMFTLAILLFLQLAVNFTRHDGLWKKVLVTFSFNFPQTIQFIVLAFYYALILMVISLLAKIGERLKYVAKDKKSNMQCFMKLDVMQSEVGLKKLEVIYVKVFDVKRSINKAFQAPILVTAVQCFHSMIYKLGQILHNIPVEAHDLRSYLQIQHFSTLMTYQATDLTVYGYFPLDATLMFKVIASATMYLIIMVQFDKKA